MTSGQFLVILKQWARFLNAKAETRGIGKVLTLEDVWGLLARLEAADEVVN